MFCNRKEILHIYCCMIPRDNNIYAVVRGTAIPLKQVGSVYCVKKVTMGDDYAIQVWAK